MSRSQSPSQPPPVQEYTSYSLHSDNMFAAFKTLKQKQEHLANIANRIRKLQQNQLKTLQKCQNHERLLNSLQKIRQQRDSQNKKIQQHRQMIKSQIQEQQHKNTKQKSHNKNSLQSVFTDIKNKRLSNYEFMKLKRKQNEKIVHKIKQLDLDQKKKLRNQVVQDERFMRESKMNKIKQKKQNIEKSNQKDINNLNQKSKMQGLEIQKLAKLQLELLQRTSQSQVKSIQVRQKYELFITNQKMALSSLRKKQNEQSIYVHPLVKRIQKRMDKYNIMNAR